MKAVLCPVCNGSGWVIVTSAASTTQWGPPIRGNYYGCGWVIATSAASKNQWGPIRGNCYGCLGKGWVEVGEDTPIDKETGCPSGKET